MKYLFSLILILSISDSTLKAQTIDTSRVVTIETNKNKFITGDLISITADSIFIKTIRGSTRAFNKAKVRSIYNGSIDLYFKETTNSSVPYYVQTALPNGEGNHYYKNYYIFGNEFNYGLTDDFNLSFGFETGSLIFNSNPQLPLIQLGAKYSFSAHEHMHFGLSTKFYFNSEGSVLMLDGPITFGGKRTNFTISPNISFFDSQKPFGIFTNLSLGLSDKSRFVVDYGYIDEVNIAAIIYEYLFKSGFTISVGAMVSEDGAIPNLSFSIPFGRWKRK